MKKPGSERAKNLKKDRGAQPAPEPASDHPSSGLLSESRSLFLIVASTVLVYANSLSGAFVFDDTKQIVGNPALRSWGNIIRAFTSDVWSFQRQTLTKDIPPPYYRPLFTIYLTINYQLFGLWEPGWHLVNLLVHTTATVLVYYLLRRLSGDNLIALLTALLFGLHPAHVESVSWISGIPDPLAALFYVPSLIWYVRYREEGDAKWLIASVVAYGLAALCKETPLALPIVFIVWELARSDGRNNLKNNLATLVPKIGRLLIPYAAVAVAYLALRFSVLGRISWKHPFMARVPDSAIWMTVPYVVVNYLRHLVAPFRLSLIYGTSFITSVSDPRFLVPCALLIVIAIVLWLFRKKLDRNLWIALTLTVAPLLPVLNLKVFHYEYIIQDRYLYLPSIGFCSLVAILLVRFMRKNQMLLLVTAGTIIVAFGAGTVLQNRVWRDAVALWQRAIYYSPQSWSTHYNLGLAYLTFKENGLAQSELETARTLNPKEANVYNNLAVAQAAQGDINGAIVNSKQALALDPSSIEAHNNLGAFLYQQGSYDEARREFTLVLEHDPQSVSAHFNLGRALAALKQHSESTREFELVLRLSPEDLEARYELAFSYAAGNQKEKAIEQFNRAAGLDRDATRLADKRKRLAEILGS